MRVLLTGATGFLGGAIARTLAEGGHEVRALVRSTSKLTNLQDLPIERAEGDVTEAASVKRAIEGRDAVVHTAGIVSWRRQDRDLVYRVNVEGTKTVLGSALEAKVARAVFTSSLAAVGATTGPAVLDEAAAWDEGLLGGLDYMRSKRLGEVEALGLARAGLPLVVVNPGFLLGPGDIYRSSATTAMAIARGRIPGYVRGGISCADVRDVAAAHRAALEGKGRPGERYILGGHNVTMDEFMSRVAGMAGRKPPPRTPYALAYVFALFGELKGRSDLNRQLLRASSLYTFADSAKASRELGYTIRPFDEMVRDTLRFFLRIGRLEKATKELEALDRS